MVSFQGSSRRPWQLCQKERGIPLDSPIMQILNLTYDPPEVWCPVNEAVTSSQMADSKGQQGEAKSGALSRENWKAALETVAAVSSSAGSLPLITNWKIIR